MISRKLLPVWCSLLLIASSFASGCRAPQPLGERDSIILRADPELWREAETLVRAALERTAYTSRPERIFSVTHVAPTDTLWDDLRYFQQVVVMGTEQDELVADLVGASDRADATPPAIFLSRDKWARGQLVTVLLLPADGQLEAIREILPKLFALLLERYDEWIVQRMYTTGVNDSLTAVLADLGFTLEVPNVYDFARQDSSLRFSNPYRQGDTDILRSLLLTWRSGAAAADPDSLRAWRERVDEAVYDPSHDVLDEGARFDTVEVAGRETLEFRGVWQDRAEFPAAGPFVARAVFCPDQDRTYYMDAWVFVPGRDKYPYLRQVEILMNSFRCQPNAAGNVAATTG